MKLVYLDTSAWVKRYVVESGSKEVEGIFAARLARACSTLGYVEAHAAVARRNRFGPDPGAFGQSLTDIAEDWRDFLGIRVSDSVLENAKRHAVAFGLRGADAIHLASAQALLKRKPKMYSQLVFAASDLELLAAADQLGLETWNPDEAGRLE